MHTTKQGFFENQPRHFGVVFFFEISDSREDAMSLGGQPNVRGLERLAHLDDYPTPSLNIEHFYKARSALLVAREADNINIERSPVVPMLQTQSSFRAAINTGTRSGIDQAGADVAMKETTRQLLHALPQRQGNSLSMVPVTGIAELAVSARRNVLLLTPHADIHRHAPYIPSIVTGVRSTICCAFSGRGRRSIRCQETAVRSLTPNALANFFIPTCLM